jgi:hypothetical protein
MLQRNRVPEIEGLYQPAAAEFISLQSGFGGCLFLLNVAVALGHFGDFTEPARVPSGLNLWTYLEKIGRSFAGRDAQDDPLWAQFQRLAGPHSAPSPKQLFRTLRREVRTYLRETLGPAGARSLVMQDARVEISPTHVHACFSMNNHPIAIRMACLDRDPGWVPAGGRYVYFHFD